MTNLEGLGLNNLGYKGNVVLHQHDAVKHDSLFYWFIRHNPSEPVSAHKLDLAGLE